MIEIPAGTIVVVDLDDTLYAERDFQTSGFRAVARQVADGNAEDLFVRMTRAARAGGDALGVAAGESGRSLPDLLSIYREHEPDIELYPDADRLLDRLMRDNGRPPVLLTDGRSVSQRNKIDALGIADRILRVCISEEVGYGKPNPLAYQSAVSGIPGDAFVYIADNPAKDFIAPKHLGWLTVMLRDRGRNVHPQDLDLPDAHWPDLVVADLDEIRVVRDESWNK